jgi:hypothetical protein
MLIYCIEDINDMKYVGKTSLTLNQRFTRHLSCKYDKNRKGNCKSVNIHLEHSIIYILEECEKHESKERERYWINKLDTVNLNNRYENGRRPNYYKEWCEKNKERIQLKANKCNKIFRENNPEYNKIWSAKKWYCQECDCEYNRSSKRLHLLSNKHQSKITVIG